MTSQNSNFSQFNIADFHTHILPSMDDGSDSISTSIFMLKKGVEQGIKTFVSTSHFYPETEDPNSFIKRREKASKLLFSEIEKNDDLQGICIKFAAEVAYFSGIGSCEEVKKLCLENTKTILLEMPFCKWDEIIINDVIDLHHKLGLNVILVHVDRYLKLGFKKYFRKLYLSEGILFQWNSSSILDKKLFKKVRKYYLMGAVNLLGSDMHNLTSRSETLGEAISKLKEVDPSKLNRIEGVQKFLIK